MTAAPVTAAQLDQAIADDDAIGFEHDGNLRAWLADLGIPYGAAIVANEFVMRHAHITADAGPRTQRDVAAMVLAALRWGVRVAAANDSPKVRVSDDEIRAAFAAARELLDQVDGDVYVWLETAGFERDVAVTALERVVHATAYDGLAGQSHLPGWWVRPEASLMVMAGLIAGLEIGGRGGGA